MSDSISHTTRYTPAMRWIHWVMALCIIGALLLGFYLNLLPSEWRGAAWRLHKSLGLTVCLLLPIRIWLRNATTLPALPGTNRLEHILAHRTHQLLYVSMGLMAFSGYLMVAAKGKDLLWFGITIPPMVPLNLELAKLARHWHEPFAYLVLALIALHLVGVIKHLLIDNTNLLKRMI